MTTPHDKDALIAELDWLIENGNTGPRSHKAIIAARAALSPASSTGQAELALAQMKWQSYELDGVIADVEQGDGFDDVCLNTVKRVRSVLAGLPGECAAPAQQAEAEIRDLNENASPADLWAEIHRLRCALKGPDGFETWQDAAVAERLRRVKAEKAEAMARDTAMEEAAKVIAAIHVIAGRQWHPGTALALQAELIEAIRALKSPSGSNNGDAAMQDGKDAA